ncbi:C-type lectin domain-containing protein [Pseudomonas sp. NPDC087639]|uniref:C-type lectin domain-containing protein n=1 Tax=Pseudomonas sp. NPDC087639 TaxID=3364445 RepID=UPI00381ED4FE
MTTSTPPDNTILVLRPPRVPEATTPVIGAILGVPKHVYDPKPMGLTIEVDPPASGTVEAGDVIRLVLNGASTEATKTIPDGGENNIQTLYLPIGLLLTDLVNELVYTITRGSHNQGTSTPALTLLYNRIRPGLKDRLTDPGGHSELKLLLPDAIKNGVAPDFLSAEVCVAYPYCRAYDRISLKCNGELMTADVNPNQAPQPPDHGSEVPITICFTVDRAYLDKAKRLDHKLNFSYTVTDQLGNGPDTDAPWSPAQTVDEDLDGVLLPMPILLERLEDFPGDDASIIDLEKLAGNPLLMVVITADSRFVAGDDVLATYTAKNTGQPADVVVTVPGKVEADPFGSKKTLFLEMANDKVFAGSSVTVTYELRRPNGDLVGNSKPAKATVTGAAPIKLLKPKIKQAPNDTSLEPLAAKDALTAVIPAYPNMIGTQVTVTWSGTAGSGSQTVGPINVSTQGDLNIPLDNAVVAFNLGKTVTVTYIVTGNDTPSDPLVLSVLPIADENPAMGMPLITQAANNGAGPEFDVSKLTTAATVRVNRWPLIALAQYVWLRLTGTKKDGNNYDETFWQPPGSQTNTTWISQGYWERLIPLATLQNLKDGSRLIVEFKAGLGGSQDEKQAVTFQKGIYTVKSIPALDPGADKSLTLPNFIVAEGRAPLNSPAEAIFTQTATGGRSPYTYTSTNAAVATVTREGGTVTCKTNGSTTINIVDENGAQASYVLTVSGIRTLLRNDSTWRTWPEAQSYCQARGGRLATLNEMRAFFDLYARQQTDVAALLGWPIIQGHDSALFGVWLGDGGVDSHYYFNLTGTLGNSGNAPWGIDVNGLRRPALCLYG